MRIRGQGLGPGFTMVHTRRSVILSADGLEFLFTFCCGACSAAASRDKSAPPTSPAELLKRSLRPILPLRLNIWLYSAPSAGSSPADVQHCSPAQAACRRPIRLKSIKGQICLCEAGQSVPLKGDGSLRDAHAVTRPWTS